MRWTARLLQIIGVVLIAYSVFVLGRGRLFQMYESWNFDRLLGNSDTADVEKPPMDPEPAPLPTNTPPNDTTPPTVLSPQPALYSVIGRIEIPRIKMSTMILEGDEERELRLGAGHIPGSALPGQLGNVVIAAHRDTFFRPLKKISRDDEIQLTTRAGTFRYIVDSVQVTDPSNVSVMKASAGPTMTLITCFPFSYVGSAPKRFIVHATEIASR